MKKLIIANIIGCLIAFAEPLEEASDVLQKEPFDGLILTTIFAVLSLLFVGRFARKKQ